MSTNSGDLKYYYPNALGSSDGEALTAFTVAVGSTDTILNSDATQADDYWNDAIVKGVSDSGSGYFEDQWYHVKDYANTSGAITLATRLPGTPTSGDTFNLIHMGKGSAYRSSEVVKGLDATDLSNITNTDIIFASFENGEGTGQLSYTAATNTFQWKAPGDTLGVGVATTGDGEQVLYSLDDTKFIRIDVTNWAALPGTDQTDNVTLTQPEGRIVPNTEAYQSETVTVRYVAFFFKNEHSSDDMNELKFWLDPQVSASTTTTSACGTTAGTLTLTDGSSFPTNSFWIYNSAADDCRYVKQRSGNTLYLAAAGGGLRDKVSSTWSIGATVSVWTDVDISEPTLTSDHLPASLSGLTYTSPMTYDTGLDYETLTAGSIGAIVVRETIIDDMYPVEALLTKLQSQWW